MALRDIRADLKERIAEVSKQLVAEHAQYIEDLEQRELRYKMAITVLSRERAIFEKLLQVEQERDHSWPKDRSDSKWASKMVKDEDFLKSLKLCEDVSELLEKLHEADNPDNIRELGEGQLKNVAAG